MKTVTVIGKEERDRYERISLVTKLLAFILFWYIWNWIAPLYLDFLPQKYLEVPFWHMMGMLLLVEMITN